MNSTAVRSLLAVVLAPTNQPAAHSTECPMSDYYIAAARGEAGDWSGDVADLADLLDCFPGVVLHPCLHKAAKDYGIPAGVDGDTSTARQTRSELLIGYVLDSATEPAPAVQMLRSLLAVHLAYAEPVRLAAASGEMSEALSNARMASYRHLEDAVNALAVALELAPVHAFHVFRTLANRPEARTW
ncbi:hypothetical protein [Planomonospora algeriensis]